MCLEHQAYCNFDVVVAEDGVWSVCADVVREYGNSLVLTHLPLGRDAGRNVVANAAMAVTKEPWWVFLGQHRTIAEASAVESPIRQETIGFPAHFFARAHNFKPPGRACQPEADSPMRT